MATMRFYFDEMMARPAANELIKRGYTVTMAVDVGMTAQKDSEHLRYATENNMVIVTEDRPFAGLTAKLTDHHGLICWMRKQGAIGSIVSAWLSSPKPTRPTRLLAKYSGSNKSTLEKEMFNARYSHARRAL